ncbi:MAG: histidine phosphatase family protein, partial [Pseudomonadota bacterium]
MSKDRTGRRRLYLMRHGHVNYFDVAVEDFRQVPLTEEGQGQARSAGHALASIGFDAALRFAFCKARSKVAGWSELMMMMVQLRGRDGRTTTTLPIPINAT